MAKLINYNKKNGTILSVTMTMTTDNEKRIYRSFMDTEPVLNICPHCGKPINKDEIDPYYIIIHNPTNKNPLGFNMGVPVVKCPHCGEGIQMSMMDIAPFTAVTAWLEKLRAAQKGKK